ncbi:hypothetical protein N4T20_09155 [Flavobacterium sp. TR2]|uniref:hypothetical protein n=1 Tax=Flavobacterium sp. TR2 TaxID=2977321 RepID=UPI0021B0AFBD|nr:hypothetical protein [Flavobacterium sp. TR2]UWY30095.1 hypothetical protein N4T20_09155 [Flavobacterium sp. TR2]
MKSKKEKKQVKKFGLEKFEIAKLKNLHLIVGGGDDPIDTNHKNQNRTDGSSINCNK